MIEAIKTFFKRIQLRFLLIAVLLSVALWFFRMNLADPITYENFTLTLRLVNEDVLTDNGKLIDNRRELDNININVHVTGLKSELDYLVKDDTIYAYVDLNSSELVNVSGGRIGTPIPVRISIGFTGDAIGSSYNITALSPGLIDIVMDEIKSNPMNVHIDKIGEPPAGYKATSTEYDPHSVRVTGPSSIVSKISRLKVDVDMTDVRSDIEDEMEIKAYDVFGEEVTGFEIDIPTVKFKIPVYKTSNVPLYIGDPAYVGTPADGIAITGLEIEPSSIDIMVHVDEVEQINAIALDPYDLTGITETSTVTHDINRYLLRLNQELGLDLMLVDPDTNIIEVTYITEPLVERQFTISVDTNIHFIGEASLGDRTRKILTDSVTVTIRGVESVVQNILPEDITGRADLTPLANLDDGEHPVEVTITVPAGTELVSSPPSVLVRLSSADPASATPDAGQSPQPEPDSTT